MDAAPQDRPPEASGTDASPDPSSGPPALADGSGTLAVIGAGDAAEAAATLRGLAAVGGRVLLVEADPDRAAGLEALAAVWPSLEVVAAALVPGAARTVELIELNWPALSGLAVPGPGLMARMPGLRVVARRQVPALSLAELMARLQAGPRPRRLLLDAPGTETALVDALIADGPAEALDRLILRCAPEPWYVPAPPPPQDPAGERDAGTGQPAEEPAAGSVERPGGPPDAGSGEGAAGMADAGADALAARLTARGLRLTGRREVPRTGQVELVFEPDPLQREVRDLRAELTAARAAHAAEIAAAQAAHEAEMEAALDTARTVHAAERDALSEVLTAQARKEAEQALQGGFEVERAEARERIGALDARLAEAQEQVESLTARLAEAQDARNREADSAPAEVRAARQDAALALRLQDMARTDLEDLQRRYDVLLDQKERQDELLVQLTARLRDAAQYLHMLPRPETGHGNGPGLTARGAAPEEVGTDPVQGPAPGPVLSGAEGGRPQKGPHKGKSSGKRSKSSGRRR